MVGLCPFESLLVLPELKTLELVVFREGVVPFLHFSKLVVEVHHFEAMTFLDGIYLEVQLLVVTLSFLESDLD